MPTSSNSTAKPTQPGRIPTLEVRDLVVTFRTEAGEVRAVDGVSFDVMPNEVLGIVGESGSGKSVTALSILRLIPDPPGKIAQGTIRLAGRNLLDLSYQQMHQVRGKDVGMIFQEPMTALNPVFTVGMQVMETVLAHERISRAAAFERVVAMLGKVGIPDAVRRMRDYPHQFSGGMRQRVMIAMALVCHPKILIADEPTTALDVTTQAQILELMLQIKSQQADASILLITHDLAVVAETCQRTAVLYGGKIQEMGQTEKVLRQPLHPYTRGLLASLPARASQRRTPLYSIPGKVPSLREMPSGCKFCSRCPEVMDRCRSEEPPLHNVAGQWVRCHLVEGASAAPVGAAQK